MNFHNSLCRTFVTIVTLIVVLVQSMSAQSLRENDPCEYARSLGADDTSGCLWFSAGCLFSIAGVAGAYLIRPNPPASLLIGKGPDYVALYADCYNDGAVGNQARWAWIGCGTGCVLVPVIYMGLFINVIMATSR